MGNAKEKRRRDLAAIHAAKRDLAMADEDYRAMLRTIAGTDSAKHLSPEDRRRVLEHLGKLGWDKKPRQRVAQHPGTPHNLDKEAQLQKIEAQLSDMKLPWSYVDAIAKRQWGIEKVAWIRKPAHFSAIIAALHVEHEKRDLLAQLDSMLETLGSDRAELESQWDDWKLKPNWHRDRRILRRIINELTPTYYAFMEECDPANTPDSNPA